MIFVFDMDGTLTYQDPDNWTRFPYQQALMPGVEEACTRLRAEGHTLAVASNQGGVAMGYLTYDEARALVENAASLIGAAFYELCPYHPDGIIPEYARNDGCRKPRPGMILEILRRANMPPSEAMYVGNSAEDEGAASNAGVSFTWAADFFQ